MAALGGLIARERGLVRVSPAGFEHLRRHKLTGV